MFLSANSKFAPCCDPLYLHLLIADTPASLRGSTGCRRRIQFPFSSRSFGVAETKTFIWLSCNETELCVRPTSGPPPPHFFCPLCPSFPLPSSRWRRTFVCCLSSRPESGPPGRAWHLSHHSTRSTVFISIHPNSFV